MASVWIAASEACNVQLQLFTGIQSASSVPTPDFQGEAHTIRILPWLHVVVVTVDLTNNPRVLEPERVYSYNLKFVKDAGGTDDLKSLSLLTDGTSPKPRLALGYQADALPTFVLPPRQLTDLRIMHGSCRRANASQPDAMRWMDDVIRDNRTDPVKRPHQMFLTGDQIYADDVGTALLAVILDIVKTTDKDLQEQLPTRFDLPPAQTGTRVFPGNAENFPAGLRLNLALKDARTTTTDGTSHLLTLAEFCAMHLLMWSNELWPDTLPTAAQVFAKRTELPPTIWRLHLGLFDANDSDEMKKDVKLVGGSDKTIKGLTGFTTENVNRILTVLQSGKFLADYNEETAAIKTFRDGLPRVRRALANVPVYMIFDDHEITDDWNFSAIWRDRVFTAPLGRTIMRNGLVAYTVCQGWGNDPKQFAKDVTDASGTKASPQKDLLQHIPQLFPNAETLPPKNDVADAIDDLLGLTGDPDPKVTWHYTVPGQTHMVLVLDVRTRRTYATHVGPPSNLSVKAIKDQIPAPPLPPQIEAVIVVSSLTVLGPPIFDAVFGPLSYKLIDIGHLNRADIPGQDPDAIEAWANDEVALERLFAALAAFGKVVMLSGDVHYSTSLGFSYWTKRDAAPARFAQFTSSGTRNVFKELARRASQSFAFMQKVIQFHASIERLGYNKSADDLVLVPPGKQAAPALDRRLQQTPALLPTVGWPDGAKENTAKPPDWAWRVDVIRDVRKDSERPAAARSAALVPETAGQDIAANLDGYRRVVVRHAKQLDQINHTRQIMFASNYGLVYFDKTNGLAAVQDLFAAHPKAANPDAPDIYMRHIVPLVAPAGKAPKIPPDPGA